MPTVISVAASDRDRSAVERISAQLVRDFQRPFELWRYETEWVDSNGRTADRQELVELLKETSERQSPQVLEQPECGSSLLAIYYRLPTTALIAVAEFDIQESNPLQRTATLYGQLLNERDKAQDADEAVDSMAEQVSSNFEELMLLRSMAEHLQLTVGPTDPEDVAKKLLPALKTTLKCEHLALIHLKQEGEHDRVYWASSELLSDQQCFDLIKQIGGDGTRPKIENEFQTVVCGGQYPSVRELALVPIGGNGWLLAINRQPVEETTVRRHEEIGQGHKFGTFEVTLMTSAASLLTTHFNNLDLLRQKHVIFTETVKSLINAVDARDPYTRGHSERVGLFCKRFAHHLGLGAEACERIYLSGLLHDIGKIGVSDATLKKPGKLTDEEYEELKQHPDQGWAILSNLHTMQDIIPGVLYHHERYDGDGYPCGLAGEDIPIEGRLMSICDAYDAMTSDRPYRAGMPQEKAESILLSGKGTQWDPQLVDEFMILMPDIIRLRETYSPRPVKKRLS